jgi:DNA-binding response OmpR family regulator
MKNMQLNRLKVLFVEDEDIIREHTATSLSFLVKELEIAANGKEALEVLTTFSPNVIITDLNMPVMDGIDFLKAVRLMDKDVIIIVLTAHDNQEYLLKLVDMHIEHFIIKPITFEKLITILQHCSKSVKESNQIQTCPKLPLGYEYNWEQKILYYNQQEILLSRKEILFLEVLIKNSHRIVTYQEIEKTVWLENIMTTGALRSLVLKLRKKLPLSLIYNLSGVGYRIILDE